MLSRRTFLRLAGSSLAAAPLLSASLLRAAPAGTFTSLRRGVGTYTQQGGTIGWLIHDDALVVVDTQYPETAPDCWSGLQERTSRPADVVINTHHHGDHTGGNGVFNEHTNRIVAHQNVPMLQRQDAQERGNVDQQVYANETFDATWHETIGDESIRLKYYGPGHTGGDIVVHFENANVAHVGDLVFNRVYPFIDIPGGASTLGWIDTLEQLHAEYTDDTLFIFGHGSPTDGVTGSREDLLVMRDFLAGLLEYVQTGLSKETPLAELANREKLPGFEDHYLKDWPIDLAGCIRAVYREQKGTAE